MNKHAIRRGHRVYSIFLFILWVLLLAIVGRVAYYQLYLPDEMREELRYQFMTPVDVKRPRGTIKDRNGDILAVSLLGGSLYVDNMQMRSGIVVQKLSLEELQQSIAEQLAPVIDVPEADFYQAYQEKDKYHVWIKRMLTPEQTQKAEQLIKKNNFIGVHIIPESLRYYPKEHLAAQVLGFVGMDDKGLSGIEYDKDELLRGGQPYRMNIVQNLFDERYMEQRESSQKQKLPTIYLTLDSKIQYVLEVAMDEAVKKHKAKAAMAILMDPHTGEVLGMVNRPTFDPNHFERYGQINFTNQCLMRNYEPGSVFKPIVGCIGLTEGIITPHTIFNDEGHIIISNRSFQNWNGEGRGRVPFSDVIKYSINTSMMKLGTDIGARRLIDYSKRYGFGAPTGIELSEGEGLLYEAKDMVPTDVATMAIGQGITVTPIQMLRAICAIANGGELLQPYIIKEIVDGDGQVIQKGEKKVIRKVMQPEIAAQMRSMMEEVVASGGGKAAGIKGYRIAGKTGTAEKSVEGQRGYARGKYMASFVGFVPADDPQYALLIIVDEPGNEQFYGSQVSAPVFHDTLQQILAAKGILPNQNESVLSFSGLELEEKQVQKLQEENKLPRMELLPNQQVKLPDFKGCDMRATAGLLRQGRLKLQPYGSGQAYKQEPAAGQVVAENTVVKVWFK